MKLAPWFPPSCALILLLSSCANNQSADMSDPLGTGPFDSAGNYREDWADDPSKWRRPGNASTSTEDLPQIAKNEEPPANATPLPAVANQPRTTTKKTSTSQTVSTKPKPTVVRAKPKPKPKPTTVRYTVRKGDTLSGIAKRHRSSVSAIRRANGISGSLIRPGQKLIVPRR